MTKITTGLATVGLATLALGVAAPAAATAAPSTSDRAAPAAGADQSPTAALAPPKIAFIQPQEIEPKLSVGGVAPGAEYVGIEVIDGSYKGMVGVFNGRFAVTLDAGDVGKTVIMKSYAPRAGSETVEFVVEPMYAEGENEAPPTPVIHAVSSYDDEYLVIEGTVTHRPDLFHKTDVWADGNGYVWDFAAENGAFSLKVPVARAGQIIKVTAYYGSHASETVEVELVPTERNTASDVHPLEVASPAAGDVLATPEATFAGSGIPNSQIVVTRDEKTNRASSTLCETRVTSQGDWSCTSPTLPAGSYDTVVTETPTWATAPKQTAGTAFSVADTAPDPGSETSDGPSTPILSSVTEGPDGRLTVRTIIHGAEHARIDVGEHSETRLRGQHGRFSFVVDGSMAGQTATITGLWRGSEGDSLDIDLTPIEAPAGSPLAAPLTHGVLEESNTFYVQGTTSYFADEYLVPTVIAQIDGEFVAATESTWNGAYILRLPASFAGQDVDLYTVRNDELSEATTITVGATEKNSAPETFPLEVTSIAEGETISTDTTSISGEGIPGSRITIATDLARAGEVCAADVLGEGTWTCELEAPLTTGQQTMTVTETPYWRTLAPLTSTRSFTVSDDSDDEDLTDLTVTSHTDGGRYSTGIATFAGRGTPDARLTAANQWGTPMGSTRVDEDG
ncbi:MULTISPECIES: hypothetical protein, partial [unclassified Frigoribacterium]|uniref:hypothetical protein n=1 Tax=unclassified Frigoribacterium TaxID=2627005 RepID=UPI0006FDBF79